MDQDAWRPPEAEGQFTSDDVEIAKVVMGHTWYLAVTALLLGVASFCCNPCGMASMLSLMAAVTGGLRLRAMAPELRDAVPGQVSLVMGLLAGAAVLAVLSLVLPFGLMALSLAL